METFEKVTAALGIFATEIKPCDRSGKATGVHFKIADRNWTLSVQWGSGNYSSIGRGTVEDDRAETYEAALWDDSLEFGSDSNWIPMTPDRDCGFGVEPMAWVTLAEIERAVLACLIERPCRTVAPEESDENDTSEVPF